MWYICIIHVSLTSCFPKYHLFYKVEFLHRWKLLRVWLWLSPRCVVWDLDDSDMFAIVWVKYPHCCVKYDKQREYVENLVPLDAFVYFTTEWSNRVDKSFIKLFWLNMLIIREGLKNPYKLGLLAQPKVPGDGSYRFSFLKL